MILCRGKKTCVGLGKILGISHDKIYHLLSGNNKFGLILSAFSKRMVAKYSQNTNGFLIIDDTLISKPFGVMLEGLMYLYSVITRQTTKGLTFVAISWSDGRIKIPLSGSWFFSKQITGLEHYKKKSKIAAELLLKIGADVPYESILFDCHYSTKELIEFIKKQEKKFISKIPKNRVITTANGVKEQIQNHPDLKLKKNERHKKIEAEYNGLKLFVSIHKVKNKNGDWTKIYLVSNIKIKPRLYIKIYRVRWEIEKIFRTTKQILGLADCQSNKIESQSMHIWAVFAAYSILQDIKIAYNLESIEAAARMIQNMRQKQASSVLSKRISMFKEKSFDLPLPELKSSMPTDSITPLNQNFGGIA